MSRLSFLNKRDVVLALALIVGLVYPKAAGWTRELVVPALIVIMMVSCAGIPSSVFRYPRILLRLSLLGIAMNFVLLGGLCLFLNNLLIDDRDLSIGVFIMAAVPPGVGIIPFTASLKGNMELSLTGTVGGYLGALVITPLAGYLLIGSSLIDPRELLMIVGELILVPLIGSRILTKLKAGKIMLSAKGVIINWGFFVVIYTIVGLNRELFLGQPMSLLPVACIAIASTFILGAIVGMVGRLFNIAVPTITSLVLLGTVKNYGLAGALALSLFEQRTSVPAAVSSVFVVVYLIWLGFQKTMAR